MSFAYRRIAPAPTKYKRRQSTQVTLYDLPPELRVEIYRLALEDVVIHILSPKTSPEKRKPHALSLTSHQVRNEVLPMIHSICPIRCAITDFDFEGLLQWMHKIPPDDQTRLLRNPHLAIHLTTRDIDPPRSLESMRKWLHYRADKCRPQARWHYSGNTPNPKICAALKRRAKRMKEVGKRNELFVILQALGITGSEDSKPSEVTTEPS